MTTTRQINNAGEPLVAPDGSILIGKKITFTLVNSSGVPGAAYDATTLERVAGSVAVFTDPTGQFTISLWPNDRGNVATQYLCSVDSPGVSDFIATLPSGSSPISWAQFAANGMPLAAQQLAGIENMSNRDISGGYAGLTLFKLNFMNALGTIKSWFTNANTAARTYTFQDRNGTIADNTDIAYASSRGALVMELGLSLCDQGRTPSYINNAVGQETFVRVWTAKSVPNYCKRWSKGGMRMNRSGGKSGDTLTGALARITDITAQAEKPKYCFVWLGGNDINGITSESLVATAYAQMQSDLQGIVAVLQAASIIPIILDMPDNATWQVFPYKLRTHYRFKQWLTEYCGSNKIKFVSTNNVMSRSKTQVFGNATISRTGNAATVTRANHLYTSGDYIVLMNSANPSADQLFFVAITVTDSSHYTFTHINSGTLVNVNTQSMRSMVYPALAADGTTHFTEQGARRCAKTVWAALQTIFPPVDTLANTNNDYYNLVGSGIAAGILQVSLSDFSGAGGTIDGSAATVTGTMPDNWDLNIINGSPTITLSLVAGTDSPHLNQNWLRLAITAGAQDAQLQVHLNHPKPVAWAANTAATVNSTIVTPVTPSGLFAACVKPGTTDPSTEPVWPTEVGKQIVDGTATWEMRAGWKNGDMCWAAMEYWISAMGSSNAITVMALGLFDDTTDANSISDHAFIGTNNGPEYEASETGYMVTPEAALAHDTTGAVNFSTKIIVKVGMTATINLRRPTWRKVGLGA